MSISKEYQGKEELSRLLTCAKTLQIQEYIRLSDDLMHILDGEDLAMALLSRAQMKLLTTDSTIYSDLRQASRLLPDGLKDNTDSLLSEFTFHSPNGFFIISRRPGALPEYLNALEGSQDMIGQFFGENGSLIASQLESEILYHMGNFRGALRIAQGLASNLEKKGRYDSVMLAQHVLLRCHLAVGDIKNVNKTMLYMINFTKATLGSLENNIYQSIRSWFNITTGWSGETQRYYTTPDHEVYPVLADRAQALQHGIAQPRSTEIPLTQYASAVQDDVYELRTLYSDIYDMLLAFKYKSPDNSLPLFDPIYRATFENRLIMPFAEYGEQIIPFLEYISSQKSGCYNMEWISRLIHVSASYEQGLKKLREE